MWGKLWEHLPNLTCAIKNTNLVFWETKSRLVPMARSLLCGYSGACLYMAENRDSPTSLVGACKRFLNAPPSVDTDLMARARVFVEKWVKRLPVLEKAPSVAEWLEESNLPAWRRTEIAEAEAEYQLHKAEYDYYRDYYPGKLPPSKFGAKKWKKFIGVTNFVKVEYNEGLKYSRNINARSNYMKARLGPWVHAMEKVIFALPSFIKYISMPDRPAAIIERCIRAGMNTIVCDYSCFETSFTKLVQDTFEQQVYKHMVPDLDFHAWMNCITSRNWVTGRGYSLETDCARMSGEMNTSLGNGITNLMMMEFAAEELGMHDLQGFVEGDDGLFSYSGPSVDPSFFSKLGFRLTHLDAQADTASFCGMVFDIESRSVVVDPFYCLAGSGFSNNAVGANARTIATLTAAKGLSIMFQYPNCPLMFSWGQRFYRTAMASAGLSDSQMRLSLHKYLLNSRRVDSWERAKLLSACDAKTSPDISVSSRLLFERLYHISPESQVLLERQFDSGTGWFSSELLQNLFLSEESVGLDGTVLPRRWLVEQWHLLERCHETPVRTFQRTPNVFSLKKATTSEQVMSAFTRNDCPEMLTVVRLDNIES